MTERNFAFAERGRAATIMPPAIVPPLRIVHPRGDYAFRFTQAPIGGGAKRLMDVAVSGCALLLLAPLLIAVALLVRLDSPGPALFRQPRGGFRGRSFHVLKFRTMRSMETGRELVQAARNDSRVTALGRVLRKTSIDELPQLINVFRGEMSLVGPRPHALTHDSSFWSVNRDYPGRFIARPGITGLAQVSGCRGETDTPEKIEARLRHDLDYVNNWSLARDIRIMLATVRLVAGDANAY